jgi:formate-dependent phosphoribosylglycinamide formyltransferase (GAR transformylase)
MGVALALGNTIEEARERAKDCANQIQVTVDPLPERILKL